MNRTVRRGILALATMLALMLALAPVGALAKELRVTLGPQAIATVSFDPGTGTGHMDAVEVNVGSQYELPSCTFTHTNEERTFYRWSVGGELKEAGDLITVNGDTTVTALWKYTKYVKIDTSVDKSTTEVVGVLTITDTRTGRVTTHTVYDETTASTFTEPSNPTVNAMVDEAKEALADEAAQQAGESAVTVVSETVSDPEITKTQDDRTYMYSDGSIDENGDYFGYLIIDGAWLHRWRRTVTLEAEYTSNESSQYIDFAVWISDTEHKANSGGSFTIDYELPDGSTVPDSGRTYTGSTNQRVESGTKVTLTAKPASGYRFKGWYYANRDYQGTTGELRYYADQLVSSSLSYSYRAGARTEWGAVIYDDTVYYYCAVFEKEAGVKWKRLAGASSLDTMAAIVDEGWADGCGGTVVVARNDDFKDALAGAGLAGLDGGPIVLTRKGSLAPQAKQQLQRLKPSRVYVAGGPGALSEQVVTDIVAATNLKKGKDNDFTATSGVIRLWGNGSPQTSANLAMAGAGSWRDGVAIIATNASFKDALSAAPVSYAMGWPILLAGNGESLCDEVLDALESLHIEQAYIVGGELAVKPYVERQLASVGVQVSGRKWGENGWKTSREIADWGLSLGLSANGMGYATSQGFPDALAGAALLGRGGSVLLLADQKTQGNLAFANEHKAEITRGYVFGGELAFSEECYNKLP